MASILIIDDEQSFRTLLRKAIEAAGHDACEAANGQEGLEQFQAQAPDLVIIDVAMSEVIGLDLIVELRRCSPNVKVIAMSGGDGAMNQLTVARVLGARRTLLKPFSFADLFRAVDHELAH